MSAGAQPPTASCGEDAATALPCPVVVAPEASRNDELHRRGENGTAEPQQAQRLPLVRQLYRAHMRSPRPRPATKELHESYAFFKKTEGTLTKSGRLDLVIDACGGHGMLGMLYVAFGKAKRAVVVDICRPLSHDAMLTSWAPFLEPGSVEFVQEDISTALPRLLRVHGAHDPLAAPGAGDRVAVVACHACAHLTRAVMDAGSAARARVATMACCHSKKTHGDQVWHAARDLGLPGGAACDLVTMGMLRERGYDCRWRTIDPAITPENRIIIGIPLSPAEQGRQRTEVGLRHEALKSTYQRAHRAPG